MKRNVLYRIVSLIIIFLLSTGMISNNFSLINSSIKFELLYDDIWGTIYNSEIKQCDKTPTITGDGSCINPKTASKHRWIAISQEMLDNWYRVKLLKDPEINRFKGKIKYNDTIWIESPYKEINGFWIVHDVKNKKYKKSVDFLQTKGDYTLYNNNPNWNGKFKNIKIYKIKKNEFNTN